MITAAKSVFIKDFSSRPLAKTVSWASPLRNATFRDFPQCRVTGMILALLGALLGAFRGWILVKQTREFIGRYPEIADTPLDDSVFALKGTSMK